MPTTVRAAWRRKQIRKCIVGEPTACLEVTEESVPACEILIDRMGEDELFFSAAVNRNGGIN